MRSRSPLVVVLAILIPVALVVGLWVGGHPNSLPGPLRDAFVDENDQTLNQGLDILQRDYYRKLGRGDLVNRSLSGAVRSLGDRFSHYFDPKAFAAFQRSTEGKFSGVGINVAPDKRGLRVLARVPQLPGQARRAGARRRRRGGQRHHARGPLDRIRLRAHPGQGGHEGHADRGLQRPPQDGALDP